jgi:hypothetical protein
MPQTLNAQPEMATRSKHAGQKSTLEMQPNHGQRDSGNEEIGVRAKHAGLKIPSDAFVSAERQKQQANLERSQQNTGRSFVIAQNPSNISGTECLLTLEVECYVIDRLIDVLDGHNLSRTVQQFIPPRVEVKGRE